MPDELLTRAVVAEISFARYMWRKAEPFGRLAKDVIRFDGHHGTFQP